jgi:hypothetical protein
MHLAVLTRKTGVSAPSVLSFSGRTAFRAAPGIIGKPFFREELLLRHGENKLCSAVTACQLTILKHKKPPQIFYPMELGLSTTLIPNH